MLEIQYSTNLQTRRGLENPWGFFFLFQTPKNSVEWKMQSKIGHFGHIFLNVLRNNSKNWSQKLHGEMLYSTTVFTGSE